MNNFRSIILAAAAAAAGLSSCQTDKTVSDAAPEKEMALQLYSIREVIGDSALYADNHKEVFARLRDMGYTGVETANFVNGKFYGVTPEQIRTDCEEAGLEPLSAHSTRQLSAEELAAHDFTEAMKWWDDAIAAHKAAGMSYIVTPWMAAPTTEEEARTLCDYHNAIGEKCNVAGIRYGYHSHSDEFTTSVGDKLWIDYMMENIAPENMFWQLDVYLAVKAVQSPVEFIKKYPGRFALLHIKDKHELGQSGMVDLKPIYEAAEQSGLEYAVVEQEGTGGDHTIMDGVAMSADYLRRADFVKATYREKD